MALSKITADSLGANAVTANSLSNTAITTALGFTPANKAGDTFTGNTSISGYLGIGNTAPTSQLFMQGSVDGASATMHLKNTGVSGRDFAITSRSDGSLRITDDTAALVRLLMDSSGNISVGNDTTAATTGSRLDLVSNYTGTQYVNVLRAKTSSTGDYHPFLLLENNRGGGANAVRIGMDSGGTLGDGLVVFQTKDSSGNFNTRMHIRNPGYVTMPYQPAFDASGGTSTFTSGDLGSVCQWNANVNRTGSFNPSNGRFTAPIDGAYYFWVHSIPQNSNSPSRVKLVKNGTTSLYNIAGQGARQIRGNDNSNTGYTGWVVSLATNDYVYLNTDTNINTESAYCGFGGWLLG